jgi:hypothetical protein
MGDLEHVLVHQGNLHHANPLIFVLFTSIHSFRGIFDPEPRIYLGLDRVDNYYDILNILVSFVRATRPCAARIRLLRLISTHNGALRAPRPSRLLCFSFTPKNINKIIICPQSELGPPGKVP